MGVQHELERLDRYQASAAHLQAEAARQLRRRRATTKTSVTPDGQTRIEFRPVPPKFQPESDRVPPRGPGDLHFRCSRGGAYVETILVVDDEDDIRTVVRKMLEAKGYTVLNASDPQQALRLATQQPVHLLLTDVVMPLLRGTELAQRVQAVSPWTKVLLMSAYKISEITASGYPFIPKPFTPDALVAKVRQVLLAQPSPFARRTPPRSDP